MAELPFPNPRERISDVATSVGIIFSASEDESPQQTELYMSKDEAFKRTGLGAITILLAAFIDINNAVLANPQPELIMIASNVMVALTSLIALWEFGDVGTALPIGIAHHMLEKQGVTPTTRRPNP